MLGLQLGLLLLLGLDLSLMLGLQLGLLLPLGLHLSLMLGLQIAVGGGGIVDVAGETGGLGGSAIALRRPMGVFLLRVAVVVAAPVLLLLLERGEAGGVLGELDAPLGPLLAGDRPAGLTR